MGKSYTERMKDLREDKDLTQTQIAEVLGIEQTVYSRYEGARAKLPIHHLIKLAKFYNTSTDYVLGLTDEIRPYPKAR